MDDNKNLNPNTLSNTGNFIHSFIHEDLKDNLSSIVTRFPPEPNGYLHIGHAKSICLNFGLAKLYGGKTNLRFDDTNPAKEEVEFVNSIKEDIKWLGFDWEDRLYYASNYFNKFYECAVSLINQGKAFVCELTPEEIRSYRGTLNSPGKESPFRNRSISENLELFLKMKNGDIKDGSLTLRAKIDMSSSNINMRDPIIYRIATITHHNTGDDWCIYPMYDFAHPIEDAIEGITHSICTMEFEDHRPLYDWFIDNLNFDTKPRQIEFAKLQLTNTIMGKRYMRALVENGEVDGWDDPRMATISGIRRRGYTPASIRDFCDRIGVSKADNRVDIALLEHCIREDLKAKSKVVMAVINPIKVVITNYDADKSELLPIENSSENPELGIRHVEFCREIYIESEDFMEDAPKKYFRLSPGKEVRLKGAYFITCTDVIKDELGNITEVHATYDPETKSGSGFTARKVKGTIHWVSAKNNIKVTTRLFDYLVLDDENEETGVRKNPNSIIVNENSFVECSLKDATLEDRFQFIRNGFFCLDSKLSTKDNLVFNRIVSLRSSYKPE